MSKEQKLKGTYFHVDWLFHEDFKDCDAQVKGNDTKYRCKVCCKSRSLSNMDITVLKKHMEDQNYFFSSSATASSPQTVISTVTGKKQTKIDKIVTNSVKFGSCLGRN